MGFGAGLPTGAVGGGGRFDNGQAEDKPAPLAPALVLDHATKSFGAVKALEDGSVELFAGEVHALVGENGAGKSTLVKILAGVHQPDSGSLWVGGHETTLSARRRRATPGLPSFTRNPPCSLTSRWRRTFLWGGSPSGAVAALDRRAMNEQVSAIFARLGVRLDPGRVARGLSVADQQNVEIAKALSLEARVIVMDEPTAALSAYEVERLFRVINTLRSDGKAVLFISHRLEEIFAICQRVTVMRDGRQVLALPLEGLSGEDLVKAMVGRDIVQREGTVRDQQADVVLKVERLAREGVFVDISFDVHAGEIVALAGLVGAGRTEVARAVFGIDRYDAGQVAVEGVRLRKGSPTAAMNAGVAFVPEDRRQLGLVMTLSIEGNVALPSLRRLSPFGVIRRVAERRFATDWATRLSLKYGRLSDAVSTLSGGNQQKVVLAKWLSRRPRMLIVDEPTRGIDIATKSEVHRLLIELADQGVAVLMISSELPEVLHVADRILVMREGRLVAEMAHEGASEESIVAAATGQVEKAVA